MAGLVGLVCFGLICWFADWWDVVWCSGYAVFVCFCVGVCCEFDGLFCLLMRCLVVAT